MSRTVGIIGVGNMGSALARGLRRSQEDLQLVVHDKDPERAKQLAEDLESVEVADAVHELVGRADLLILAVKPNDVDTVLSTIAETAGEKTTVLSVAAGVSLERLRIALGPKPNLFRIMPNLAVALGSGVVAVSGEGSADEQVLEDVEEFLSVLGATAVIDEGHFDAVTAVAASGPGLLALVLDAFEDAGVSVGLSRPVARLFVQQMALGTARSLLESEESPADFKNRVTSPAGTTIAGIAVLEDAGVRGAIIRAVEAAESRAGGL